MINQQEVFAFIKQRIENKANKFQIALEGEIDETFSITGSGLFDSMDFMNLIVEVEEKFKVEVDFSEFEPEVFTTVGGFIKCVK